MPIIRKRNKPDKMIIFILLAKLKGSSQHPRVLVGVNILAVLQPGPTVDMVRSTGETFDAVIPVL